MMEHVMNIDVFFFADTEEDADSVAKDVKEALMALDEVSEVSMERPEKVN